MRDFPQLSKVDSALCTHKMVDADYSINRIVAIMLVTFIAIVTISEVFRSYFLFLYGPNNYTYVFIPKFVWQYTILTFF